MDRVTLIALLAAPVIAVGGWLIQVQAQDMGASQMLAADPAHVEARLVWRSDAAGSLRDTALH
ncbi:hypothetical protein [Halovulum marinum]|uniref:hypothetical protein n=1 Tax=Halovulum marinum TaxID=2662447 RepID=UPI0012B3C5CE|nr:hypothetical protein [Halovulum marinum]